MITLIKIKDTKVSAVKTLTFKQPHGSGMEE